jgi:hypothetical protein
MAKLPDLVKTSGGQALPRQENLGFLSLPQV